MEVVICSDEQQVGQLAADRVVAFLRGKATPVLGLATGSSPLALYSELAQRIAQGQLDLSHALGFALDEYVGISPDHPQSYRQTILRTVVEPMKMDPERVRVPNGFTADLAGAAAEYDAAIQKAGGVDVQVLGIGSNGHIGFNEPTSSFSSRTRPKTLTQQTRDDNARFFDEDESVPTHCVTQGLGTIMESKMAIMVASGKHKAKAIHDMIEGPVAAVCPASILQFHQNCLVVLDEAAASKLQYADYFRYAASTEAAL